MKPVNPWLGITVLLTLAASCQEPAPAERGAGEAPKEAWDGLNAPEVFGNLRSMRYQELAQEQYLWGTLATRPWSDDYWPWMRAGLAHRWLLPQHAIRLDVSAPDYGAETQRAIADFLAFARQADESTRQRLSPLEKYDMVASRGFPLTTKELRTYAGYKRYYEENDIPWAWMGSCDGWAIASLHQPAPRHAVLAYGAHGVPVLFTSGDIRGLSSKAFTDNHKSHASQIIGTRCNRRVDELSRDADGRIVDGTLGHWRNGILRNGRDIRIVYNNWRLIGHQELSTTENVIVFRYEGGAGDLFWLRAVAWTDQQREIARVEVRPLQNGRLDRTVPALERDFRYLKSCRDLNAGAFHLVLAQHLSMATAGDREHARGFAIEISGADEVWNQPVYAYTTNLGAPLDLATVSPRGPQDPYGHFRAPGTRYLVHAYTTVYFGKENGPLVVYDDDDELIAYTTYQYTLELDASGYIIGGEWHPVVRSTSDQLTPLTGTALLAFLQRQTGTGDGLHAPDFLWRYPAGTRFLSTCDDPPCLSADILSRLLSCSGGTPRAGDTVFLQGHTIPFVRCWL